MKELETILKEHASRYPQMEPRDAVKLIYQNEFGGGHLIRDPDACLNYLQQEYSRTQKSESIPVCEQIGNGIVRVNLAALTPSQAAQLGQAFLASEAEHRGTLEVFRKKLDVLTRLTEEGVFSFRPEALRTYLAAYEAAGYPVVSHSTAYREAYHPAYRIILEKYCFQ